MQAREDLKNRLLITALLLFAVYLTQLAKQLKNRPEKTSA